MLALINSDL